MRGASEIATVELSDNGSGFRLDALCWGDEDEEHLLVSVEISTPSGVWRSRAAAIMAPDIAGIADAANESVSGPRTGGAVGYALDAGPCLAFAFTLVKGEECVEVAVVIDEGLMPDQPVHPEGRPDAVLLRVKPQEVTAFAEALEAIASRDPERLAWVG